MGDIVDFKPDKNLIAAERLDAFITWAKDTLSAGIPHQVHAGIRWDMDSWHQAGMKGVTFKVWASPRKTTAETKLLMQPPLVDFAKAIAVYRTIFLKKIGASDWVFPIKALEVSLVELMGTRDVTLVTPAVCNRACELYEKRWRKGNNAYTKSKNLEAIIVLMNDKGLLARPFRWRSPLKQQKISTLKQQNEDQKKKLPSRESLKALGELFNNGLTGPLDVVVTSACALLLSQPSRIGELSDVRYDPIIFKESANGERRMFLRWYAEKGFGATTKPVMTGMEPVVERLIERMLPITDEARKYAAWLEDHPDEFPPHKGVPDKGHDSPLTYSEACSALRLTLCGKNSARWEFKAFFTILSKRKVLSPDAKVILDEIMDGWDKTEGKKIFVEGKRGLQRVEFDDKAHITLRKLNILVREKYLPKDFPYTSPLENGKKRLKFRDALFTVRTGGLVEEGVRGKTHGFGVEIAANTNRMTVQLGGFSNTKSIFERHGYKGVRVNTHAFRHELNTEMHRAGLSQLLIDAFSGRTTMGCVYNHETVEERTQAVAAIHPKTKQSNAVLRFEKIRTNAPLSLSDVTDLAEGDQDRVVHQTHIGICVHDFASEPCPKMGSCLTCGKLGCVKGDGVKLKNIKEERDYLLERKSAAVSAQSRGVVGANEWVRKVGQDLFKCNALIKLLENPELENGDIVWNADNGWNLTKNAVAMAGLHDPKMVEVNSGEATLPSLDDLSAMLDEIEI